MAASVLLAVLWGVGLAAPAFAQVPDKRGLRLDTEDSVPPAYRDTLNRRDRQRLDAAREAGESFMPVFQGRGVVPEAEPPRAAAARQDARVAAPSQPAYEAWRRPDRPARPVPGRDGPGAGDLIGALIKSWTRPPEIVRVRYPAVAARNPGAATYRNQEKSGDRRPQAAESIVPHIGAGRGIYAHTSMRAPSIWLIPTIPDLCCWNLRRDKQDEIRASIRVRREAAAWNGGRA